MKVSKWFLEPFREGWKIIFETISVLRQEGFEARSFLSFLKRNKFFSLAHWSFMFLAILTFFTLLVSLILDNDTVGYISSGLMVLLFCVVFPLHLLLTIKLKAMLNPH